MEHVIQSVLRLSISPDVMRVVGGLLTWRKNFMVLNCWIEMRTVVDQYDWCARLLAPEYYQIIFTDDIRNASYSWICKVLASNVEMGSSFFNDGRLYADVALLYAQGEHWPHE